MKLDFIHLGTLPSSLESIDAIPLSDLSLELKSKVVLIELTNENLTNLLSNKVFKLEHCVFIYYAAKETELSDSWFQIFNQLSPSFILSNGELNASYLNEGIRILREQEQERSFQRMLIENKSEFKKNYKNKLLKLQTLETKLLRANKRALQIKIEEELNLNCLEIIFNSKSIGEIEDKILPLLEDALQLMWMRILVTPSDILSDLPTVKLQKIYRTEIFDLDHDKKKQGKVIFAFKKNYRKKTGTNLLLQRICDALSLRIKQLSTENEIENTKTQWETTFKSLPFKAALIDKNYNIVQTGGEFKTKAVNKPCYKVFFKRVKPCTGCTLGTNFLIDQKNESLEVNSKKVFDPVQEDHYFLNFYRDFEVSTLGESRKATKTKLEELGIISGSIAHELNNPLGGIKILLELLKEDEALRSEGSKEDLKILKNSTEKCIHIVSELLSFTRPRTNNNPLEKTLLDFFNQLKTFTQAYLLSEGFVLNIPESPLLKIILSSPDATLPIKLLESVSHYIREVNKKSLDKRKEIYLSAKMDSKNDFSIIMSNSLLPENKTLIPDSSRVLSISPTKSKFISEENGVHFLRLSFTTGVKTSATHV